MQDKAVLGKRYTCFKCSTKFYDLNRTEPLCPKCGADQREDPTPDPKVALLQKGGRGAVRVQPAAVKPPVAEGEAEPDEEADFDLDEDLDEEEFSEGDIEEEEEEEVEEEPE
jgi:hypothetical protein